MLTKLTGAAATTVLVTLALAPAAQAHNVSVSPRFGAVFRPFAFTGTQWQPFRRVRITYDQNADGGIDQTGGIFPNRYGYFRFRWNGEDVADTHRMCFRQFDTRYGRTYTKCRLFTANT
jgi:hypothetical protein